MTRASVLEKNLAEVKERIESACRRAGRDPREVLLLPVTKTHPVEVIREASKLGLGPFGESYAQELMEKAASLPEIKWHFIGRLQRNKVKHLPSSCVMIETVDSERLLETIDRRFPHTVECLIEVHLSGEESKSGLLPEELSKLLESSKRYKKPRITGLMTMAAFEAEEAEIRSTFRRLRELRDGMNQKGVLDHPLTHLSMGMSSDLEIAVEEGATIVRVGSALFGERPPRL